MIRFNPVIIKKMRLSEDTFERFVDSRSEDVIQRACVAWFERTHPGVQGRLKVHHSPNGGARDIREGVKFKRMGVRAGFPDLIVFLPRGRIGFIEMKSADGKLSPAQKDYRDFLIAAGHRWACCRSLDEFINTVTNWEREKDDFQEKEER